MKKIILYVLVFLLGHYFVANAGIVDHPAYTRINTLTQDFVSAVSAKQAEYFVTHGYYFQGVKLVSGEPDGVTDLDADVTKKPHDQAESWFDFDRNFFKNNLKVPFQVIIDVYKSRVGQGWILQIDVWYDGLWPDAYGTTGNHWIYKHHEGPWELNGIFDEWHIKPAVNLP